MNSVPEAYRVRTDQLKKNFSNTVHMYRKYCEKYRQLFNYATSHTGADGNGAGASASTNGRGGRGESQQRKKEKIRCTAKTLYEFCWCLYASIKGEKMQIPIKKKRNFNVFALLLPGELNENVQDLIMTHNLLMCCLDLIFANCVSEKRYDLINPNFKGLPADWKKTTKQQQQQPPPCILKHLSSDTSDVEMLEMKRYMFRDAMRRLVTGKTLQTTAATGKSDEDTASLVHRNPSAEFLGLLSDENFDSNFRGINKKYDEYVLNNGQIDEKLFLVADNFGGNSGAAGGGAAVQPQDMIPPATPLTQATDSVRKLNSVLGEVHTAMPPERIITLFK